MAMDVGQYTTICLRQQLLWLLSGLPMDTIQNIDKPEI